MADENSGRQYSAIRAQQNSRVVAGDAYNNSTTTNTNTNANNNRYYLTVNYNIQFPSPLAGSQQIYNSPSQVAGTPPSMPWQSELAETANVTSPSQSSDSTNFDCDYESIMGGNEIRSAPSRPTCQVIKPQTSPDDSWLYFFSGEGLARYIVERYVPSMVGGTVRVKTHGGQQGWLVSGRLLTQDDIAELLRQSSKYEREIRVHRELTSRR